MNWTIQVLDDASPAFNEPITSAKIADAQRLLDACEELRQEWLLYLPTRPTEVRDERPNGRSERVKLKPRPMTDLHEVARSLPQTDRGFKSMVNEVIATLDHASVEDNWPITDEKSAEVRRLFDAVAELRQEWLPYLQSGLIDIAQENAVEPTTKFRAVSVDDLTLEDLVLLASLAEYLREARTLFPVDPQGMALELALGEHRWPEETAESWPEGEGLEDQARHIVMQRTANETRDDVRRLLISNGKEGTDDEVRQWFAEEWAAEDGQRVAG